jgi:hypothetical protein
MKELPDTIKGCLWEMRSQKDRDRVLRLCQHILSYGRWTNEQLDELASHWHCPVPTEKWRRECAWCLDRIVAEGKPDPLAFLRSAIQAEARRVNNDQRPVEYIWWLKDGYALLTRPKETDPEIYVRGAREAAERRRQLSNNMESL